jgi:hypothetical protein
LRSGASGSPALAENRNSTRSGLGDVQGGELLLDRGCEAAGRRGAGGVEHLGAVAARLLELAGAILQGAEVLVRVLELLELGPHLRETTAELADLHAVLASQSVEVVQAILRGLELGGLDLELGGESGGRARRLLAGDRRQRELLLDELEVGRVVPAVARPLEQRRQPRGDRVIGLVQRAVGFTGELGPALGVAQQHDLASQRLGVDGVRIDCLELLDREPQVVDPQVSLGGAAREVLQGGHGLAPRGVAGAVKGEHLVEAGPGVEHLEVPRGVGQEVVLVLRADVDELLAELGEHGLGHQRRLHGRAPAAASGDRARDEQSLVLGRGPEAVGAEDRGDAIPRADVGLELGVDLPRLGALADHVAARAGAAEQRERADDDRLARPGLAGEHVESHGELERHVFEQREAADPQVRQHRRAVIADVAATSRPSPACARARRTRSRPAARAEAESGIG